MYILIIQNNVLNSTREQNNIPKQHTFTKFIVNLCLNNDEHVVLTTKKLFSLVERDISVLHTASQNYTLFIKRKLGLFKSTAFKDKRIRQILNTYMNIVKHNTVRSGRPDLFNKRPKTIFYKKLNKLFFRAGRTTFTSNTYIKKYLIQKYISKKIMSMIKKELIPLINRVTAKILLVKCGVFYAVKDAKNFISTFGIRINDKIIHDFDHEIKENSTVACVWSSRLLLFFLKKRQNVVLNLCKTKVYKFRSKLFLSKKKSFWIPSKEWLQEHSCLYTHRHANLEFDLRTLVCTYLYSIDGINFINFPTNMDISIYMARSYNWKYII